MYNKTSINEEMNYLRERNKQNNLSVNFQALIHKQQQVIQALQSELLLLKSYITIKQDVPYSAKQTSAISSGSVVRCVEALPPPISDQTLMREISQILELRSIDRLSLINAIKQLKETGNKSNKPIFVQKIKQIKVPITIQKIIQKPVEKVVQRIVYVDKPTVVFKQKIVQKFIERKDQPSLNTSHSQKTIKIQRYDKQVEDNSRYYGKYQNSNSRKPQNGTNLVKKRQNTGKFYPKY